MFQALFYAFGTLINETSEDIFLFGTYIFAVNIGVIFIFPFLPQPISKSISNSFWLSLWNISTFQPLLSTVLTTVVQTTTNSNQYAKWFPFLAFILLQFHLPLAIGKILWNISTNMTFQQFFISEKNALFLSWPTCPIWSALYYLSELFSYFNLPRTFYILKTDLAYPWMNQKRFCVKDFALASPPSLLGMCFPQRFFASSFYSGIYWKSSSQKYFPTSV